jgi:hypothetical protein
MQPKDIKYIVVHCSDSPHRGDTAEDIHRWHKERGFDGIGYHKVIREDGKEENGRPLYWPGAHVRGHNSHSWGICLLGTDTFTKAQIARLGAVIQRMKNLAPQAKLVGHRDLDGGKTCPNFELLDNYELIKGDIIKWKNL